MERDSQTYTQTDTQTGTESPSASSDMVEVV